MPDLLNACGFYVQFTNNSSWIPPIPQFLTPNSPSNLYRYRLMEMLQPTEDLEVYSDPALATNVPNIANPTFTNQYQSVYPPKYDPGGTATAYNYSSAVTTYNWITHATTATANGVPSYVRPLADNIIALIIQPMVDPADYAAYPNDTPPLTFPTSLLPNDTPTSFDYTYDSRRDTINVAATLPQQLEQNQLPPMMQVTMVAIDEASAIRLAAQYGTASPDLITKAEAYNDGSPPDGTLFTQTSNYAADLLQLTSYLTSIHVRYRVFTAQVPMFNAKWTTH
jgi:uncharacterized protein (TIGR02599 family)